MQLRASSVGELYLLSLTSWIALKQWTGRLTSGELAAPILPILDVERKGGSSRRLLLPLVQRLARGDPADLGSFLCGDNLAAAL